jgi:hypothetical protein
MKRLRLLVPIAVVVALLLLLIAPAGALAAPDLHRGGHYGGHHGGGGHGCTGGFTYYVRWGDTLGNIAWRYGVNSTYLAQVNGLCNPNRIYAGQTLWIPSCW